jgi:hypothetical protein
MISLSHSKGPPRLSRLSRPRALAPVAEAQLGRIAVDNSVTHEFFGVGFGLAAEAHSEGEI